MELRLIIMAIVCLSIAQVVFAGPEKYHFANDQDQRRFYKLSKEFRCTTCQNQSISESNSLHAIDIRAQIYQKICSGDSDQTIRDFLAYRYGEHILYNPSWRAGTWVLWLGPILMLIAAAWFSVRLYRSVNTSV